MKKKIICVILVAIILILRLCVKCHDDKAEKINSTLVYSIVIEINYEYESLSYNDNADVYIDDGNIGVIKAGECKKYNLDVTGGEHKIWVEGGNSHRTNNSTKVAFKVDEDNTYFPYKLKDGSILGLSLSVDYSKK